MALLAESLVDEWLNRKGFFTVRGLKHGVGELDLLGVRPGGSALEAWHVEVQASFRPIGYITPLPAKSLEGFAKTKTSMKARQLEQLEPAVAAWVEKKFLSAAKRAARDQAWPGLNWKYVLVHAVVREQSELDLIASHGVDLIPLHRVLEDLGKENGSIKGGAGTDLSELIQYFYRSSQRQ
ncbi:hypothetical protein GJ699_00180 [Duganella sp. FT80W]|uniref:Uncharacterized protein n=1 Tax=Duganella guangzhouensis TaxID=2666084 RepID=A0A6I2KT31_9BURK|nr:hypothetical protein [Duganella guangzhouensis]MRW88400.1 hypothetical protein [Duganella guangzhouensis]